MGNTHPLSHVLLYWLSAAPGKSRKHPSSVSLNFPLRFLSPYQEAVCAISTQGRSFSSARQMPFRSVGFRGTIHSPKLHAKASATKSKLSDTPHVQSRDVQYMSHVVMQPLKRGRSFQALRKIFEKTQSRFGIDRMRAWKVHPVSRQFSDPSV